MAKMKFTINDYYIIEVDQQKSRIYLTLMGYWQNKTSVESFLEDIQAALQKMRANFTLLVDMTHYDGTSSELHSLHIEAQKLTIQKGPCKIAEIFSENKLVKLFSGVYSKESGANTMAFKSKEHGERWLDLY